MKRKEKWRNMKSRHSKAYFPGSLIYAWNIQNSKFGLEARIYGLLKYKLSCLKDVVWKS